MLTNDEIMAKIPEPGVELDKFLAEQLFGYTDIEVLEVLSGDKRLFRTSHPNYPMPSSVLPQYSTTGDGMLALMRELDRIDIGWHIDHSVKVDHAPRMNVMDGKYPEAFATMVAFDLVEWEHCSRDPSWLKWIETSRGSRSLSSIEKRFYERAKAREKGVVAAK